MNSNVHPLVVALVLILTGIAIVTWMWGSGEAASIGGPAELKADGRGHSYVQIQNELVEHDANGQYLKTHDLRDMGVELFLGSFDFFSNGDILLRRGPDPRSVGDNIRAFQRKTNLESIEPDSPESGLFRCELQSKECTRFGVSGIDFKAAHGTFIDRTTDNVYISDTTRHVLRKFSDDGLALAEPVSGFRFPNQILILDDKLFIADTNHHEVRVVDPATENFAAELARKNVAPAIATAAGQTWPSHFTRVGDGWWVNNMRSGMNQGGVYLFDNNWRLVRKLDLPDGADPIALLATGDEVWISDWYNDKVRRFTNTGEPLSDLDSAGLETILARARTERTKFEMISYSGIALILLILAGLAVRGFAVGMSTDTVKSAHDERSSRAQSPERALVLTPDRKVLKRMTLALRFIILMLLFAAGLVAYIAVAYDKLEFGVEFVFLGTGIFAFVILIAWINRSNCGTSIRVDGATVTLRNHNGRESSCSMRELRYDDTTIATRDVSVFLGRAPASIYNRDDLKEKLFPRLVGAQKVSPIQMQKILIQQQHPQGITLIMVVVGLLIYGVSVVSN